jgi:hypothetical protein
MPGPIAGRILSLQRTFSARRRTTMMKEIAYTLAANLALALALVAAPAMSGDKAPMPQTKGMQGMDPALHDKWATESQDPYKDCTPNAEAAAIQARHPMPETRGMKGMDPKAHTMDCPEGHVRTAKPAHVHKTP